MDEAGTSLAVELFCVWGLVHQQSNGDLVLRPQELADVLACVFSAAEATHSRVGEDVRLGVLSHREEVLRAIWGEEGEGEGGKKRYATHLWRCEVEAGSKARSGKAVDAGSTVDEVSPFVDLLHRSGLAYPLLGPDGKPMHASLIPALLPEIPCGMSRDSYLRLKTSASASGGSSGNAFDAELCKLLLPEGLLVSDTFVLTFSHFPSTLFGRLQVTDGLHFYEIQFAGLRCEAKQYNMI